MKTIENFLSQLPHVLAELYNDTATGEKPSGFVFAIIERFAEAHAKGAVFFGPIAAIPQDGRNTEWLVKDLRGGWGFNPIDMYIYTDHGIVPTLDTVHKELVKYAQHLRSKADDVERLANELCEQDL